MAPLEEACYISSGKGKSSVDYNWKNNLKMQSGGLRNNHMDCLLIFLTRIFKQLETETTTSFPLQIYCWPTILHLASIHQSSLYALPIHPPNHPLTHPSSHSSTYPLIHPSIIYVISPSDSECLCVPRNTLYLA